MKKMNEPARKWFANAIETKMEIDGITMGDLAKRANVSLSTLYDILKGKGTPRVDTLKNICSALSLELQIGGANRTSEEQTLIYKIMSLTEEKRHLIEDIVDFLKTH